MQIIIEFASRSVFLSSPKTGPALPMDFSALLGFQITTKNKYDCFGNGIVFQRLSRNLCRIRRADGLEASSKRWLADI
jgi:hypothetical protein